MRFLASLCVVLIAATLAFSQERQNVKSTAEVSMNAPAFTATALSGKTYSLKDLKGKVVVLNFWSVKCPICADETPSLNALVDAYKGKDVVFLGFAHDSRQRVEQFLKSKPFKYEIIPAGLQQMIVPYGKPLGNGFYDIEFPTHILINQDGIIEVNQTGYKGLNAVKAKLEKIFTDENLKAALK
jgi:peroxiredoxin